MLDPDDDIVIVGVPAGANAAEVVAAIRTGTSVGEGATRGLLLVSHARALRSE